MKNTKGILTKRIIYLLAFIIALPTFAGDIIENTEFGEDTDSYSSNRNIEVLNNYSKPNNNTPMWNQTDLIYTEKSKKGYWQIDYGQYQRYNTADNSILLNSSNEILTTENNSKLIGSISLGAGDFSGAGYIPKFKTGAMLQITNSDFWASPIFDYKYNRYQTTYSNYLGIYAEKYYGNYRFLVGPLVTQSSFYKNTFGGKFQTSYYPNDRESINYYFSSSDEPEIIGSSTQVWRVISNSVVYKYRIGKNFTGNIGAEYVVNQNIYNKTGIIIGIGYDL